MLGFIFFRFRKLQAQSFSSSFFTPVAFQFCIFSGLRWKADGSEKWFLVVRTFHSHSTKQEGTTAVEGGFENMLWSHFYRTSNEYKHYWLVNKSRSFFSPTTIYLIPNKSAALGWGEYLKLHTFNLKLWCLAQLEGGVGIIVFSAFCWKLKSVMPSSAGLERGDHCCQLGCILTTFHSAC